MEITEPMTMITDYLIAIESAFITILILYKSSESSAMYLALSVLFTGIGAIFGGTAHGFAKVLSNKLHTIIWKTTTYTIGIATVFFLHSAILSSVTSISKIIFIALNLIAFIIYAFWMFNHDSFLYVVLYYVPSMILILGLKIYSWFSFMDPSSGLIILGIVITFIGTGFQAAKISIHKHFNHNDIFHVIQMISIYVLYLASMKLVDL